MRKIATNWILEYSERMNVISEAPAAYNVWAAISMIGAVLKNYVWVNRGIYDIFPNQYIVLIGPPGVGKGTAMTPAHALAKDHTPVLANYMNDRLTAPKILDKLANGPVTAQLVNGVMTMKVDSSAILYSTELSAFLSGSDWMIPFLCALWDQGKYDYETKNSGNSLVKNMCVSLIAGCVPDFIRNLNKTGKPETAISGGFTARAIFVFAGDKSKSIVWPQRFDATPQGKQLESDLKHDLDEIIKLRGEFRWEPRAKFMFENFYKKVIINEDDSDVVRNFKARQNIHVLKVAMCFSAASRDDLLLDEYSINTAIKLVQAVFDTLNITFRGVGESSLADAMNRIMTYMERKGICSRQSLIRDNYRHVTTDDLDRIIITLKQMGFLMEVKIGSGYGYQVLSKQP